jgi:hypothetical protein
VQSDSLTAAHGSSGGTAVDSSRALPMQKIASTDSSSPEPAARRPLVQRLVRIQLLNATTEKGLARRVSPRLRAMGFDVREVGNAGDKHAHDTELIDRSGGDSLGSVLADSLRIPRVLIHYELNPALVDIDVTLILGRDFRNYELPANR